MTTMMIGVVVIILFLLIAIFLLKHQIGGLTVKNKEMIATLQKITENNMLNKEN